MKKIFFIIGFLISVTVFPTDIRFLTHSSDDQTIIDKNGELRGIEHAGKRAFYVEIVREMMNLMKIEKKIEKVPLVRGMLYVQKEDNYALFNVSRIPEREDTVKWVGPILVETDYFYEMKNALTGIKTMDDAKKVNSIGVVRGGVHERILLNLGFTNLYPVNSYQQTYTMLKAGRLNLATATASGTLKDTLKDAGISMDEIQQTPVVVIESGGYLVFSKNISDEVIRQWQAVFDKIKKSDKFQQLYNLYALPE